MNDDASGRKARVKTQFNTVQLSMTQVRGASRILAGDS
jgi:hypothetical protein